jgi:hypothetical protein
VSLKSSNKVNDCKPLVIGKGAFGTVYRGAMFNIPVGLNQLNSIDPELERRLVSILEPI